MASYADIDDAAPEAWSVNLTSPERTMNEVYAATGDASGRTPPRPLERKPSGDDTGGALPIVIGAVGVGDAVWEYCGEADPDPAAVEVVWRRGTRSSV